LVFGTATIVLFVLAILIRGEPRLFAAAAACGAVWWAWDLIQEHLVQPLGGWLTTTLLAGGAGIDDAATRPKLDDLIRLLERHIVQGTSRQVDINAAIRLEEIYRTVKKDPERARAVIETVRARYPGAPELARYVNESDGELGAVDS
jgi:hypothetical protein